MELDGTLAQNLHAAIASARRLACRPVHEDTLGFWRDLLAYAASRKKLNAVHQGEVAELASKLQDLILIHEG